MWRSQLLLVGELTKALYFVAPSTATAAKGDEAASTAANALSPRGSDAVARQRQTGKITGWDPFERHGVICDAAGHRYRIANTRAFETVLPTMLRTLEGAVVQFDVERQATADRVIIRSRLTPITAESYRQQPPVNFLSAEMLAHLKPVHQTRKEAALAAAGQVRTAPETLSSDASAKSPSSSSQKGKATEQVELFAKNITVDIASIPAKQIARWSGPLSEEEVITPTKNLKDMRSSRVFDRETNAYLKLKQQLGSSEEARRLLSEQRERAEASAPRRVVLAENVTGVILAWSGIHRSGLIREGDPSANTAEATEASAAAASASAGAMTAHSDHAEDEGRGRNGGGESGEPVCIIRNVYAFSSALPTSQSLLERRVTFTKVTYSTLPNRVFAENIEVAGDVTYDNAVPSLEEAHAAKQRERAASLRSGRPGAMILDDSEGGATASGAAVNGTTAPGDQHPIAGERDGSGAKADGAASSTASVLEPDQEPIDPNKMHYGVIVRWSGGQGVVEGGDGRHYFLRSAADFLQLVDQSSHQLRGAVVQFKRDPDNARYAREVDILSTATTTLSEAKPLVERAQVMVVRGTSRAARDGEGVPKDTMHSDGVASTAEGGKAASAASDVEPEGVEWIYGTLLSWSSVEGQGIVISDADSAARYVLRDPDENVIAYAAKQHLLKKGRQVKFTTFGSTGRLVCNLVLLDSEIEEESLRQEELRPKEPELTLDGNMNEAIPSPMSTSYWLNRMDKAGYDTKEVKDLQNRALTLDEDDDDDGTEGGKFLDSEELLKKDHWWNDPRKNVRFPNSDMTAGHLALIGPASMMNVAMKTKDPKKLDKMLKKYQSRLTEDQKEYAWKQAKEMAPKYEECVRKGRERNEEPKFYFF